ncbi:iron permease [Cristinia sonorae]|uniref:Iron permease n=1 Tax=Cristinia sonorae TaxID=1940300 RepID=A0A8K0UDR1_9AGAR|nr:iron permease [Cristinia sonorae]
MASVQTTGAKAEAEQPQEMVELKPEASTKRPGKGSVFCLSLIAILFSVLLAALDLTAVSTILPTLTEDLNGKDNFTWVASAYALASAAILPLIGGLADVFGRKPVMMGCIILFSLGSALAGAAKNMDMMIAARTVQGLGGGGISTVCQIVIADLVPLSERGLYQGFIGLVFSLAAGIGPIVGGVFAQKVSWRWLFYLNLPIAGISLVLVAFFLRVRTPQGSFWEKVAKVDWFGNVIVIAGTTLAIMGLTWGGTRYPWVSVYVLVPLFLGLGLLAAFVVYEAHVPKVPTIPFRILNNTTTYSGYICTFIHGIASITLIYYTPIYFQACLNASPIQSSVYGFPNAFLVSPFSFVCGVWVRATGRYRIPNAVGWVFTVVGFGLMSLLRADSRTAQWVGYQILVSIGVGLNFGGPMYAVLAPLPVTSSAYALAFFQFTRTFAYSWGMTISSTVLQNQLQKRLPVEFISSFPQGLEIAISAIPKIRSLPQPLQSQVQVAFADSLSVVWKTMIGISAVGILVLPMMKDIPMGSATDETFGLDVKSEKVEEKTA